MTTTLHFDFSPPADQTATSLPAPVAGQGVSTSYCSWDALIALSAIRIWQATALVHGDSHRKTLRALNEARREAANIIGGGL